jgi:hypothetical protein
MRWPRTDLTEWQKYFALFPRAIRNTRGGYTQVVWLEYYEARIFLTTWTDVFWEYRVLPK